ncbi:MAG: hypothetical protein ACF8LK_10280 [Phycisphaerales bacterium JB041]
MRWTPEVVVTLLVRFGGLAVAIAWIPSAIRDIAGALISLNNLMNSTLSGAVAITMPGLLAVLLSAAGSYCFLSGRWVIGRLLRGVRDSHRCTHCGYDLRELKPGSTRCPECGRGVGQLV